MCEFSGKNPFVASSKPSLGLKSILECTENDFSQSEDFRRNVNGPHFPRVSFLDDDFGEKFSGENPFVASSKPPLGVKSIIECTENDFSQSEDFRRESLGILDMNAPDFEQMSFFGRESILIRKLRGLDIDRELAGGNTNLIHTLPEVVVSDTTISSVVNNGFLKRSSSSVGTTVSSISPSFHSDSLDRDQKKKSEDGNCEKISAGDESNIEVFIEARHLASKIADASFVEAEDDMLQSIREAQDFANVSHRDSINLSRNLNASKLSEQNNTSRGSNRSANFNSQSTDAMLSSISEFVSNNPNEAVDFLSRLSDFMLSRTITRSPSAVHDSGHSSMESIAFFEPPVTYEMLNLSKKSSSETSINRLEEVCVPLDLLVKSRSPSEKYFLRPKTVLPPKFNNQKILSVPTNKNLASNCSTYSNGNKNSDAEKKFIPRKAEEKVAGRRGPMEAVLPVNMPKGKSTNLKITPTRSETKSICKLKKASTPINEPLIKPMAQSTPDLPKNVCSTFPVARPNKPYDSGSKSLKEKLTKLPKNKANSFIRKASTAEVKIPPSTKSPSLDRKLVLAPSKVNSNIKQTSQKRSLLPRPKTESTSVSTAKKIDKENVH